MSAPPNLRYNALQEKIESGERILSKLMLKMDKRIAINVAWEYFNQSPYMWNGHSSKLNIKTTVRTYDEEDGQYPVGTVVHYIQDGKTAYCKTAYCKTVYCKSTDINELGIEVGEQPIFYYGSFEINNHNFELCFDRLKEGFIEFKPKQDASYYNTKNLMHI